MDISSGAGEWASEQAATATFGNSLRVDRFRRMLRRLAEHAAGQVTKAFPDSAERQGAYKFIEGSVPPTSVINALSDATLRASAGLPFIYVPVDGTSLSLTDRIGVKDFGSVGARAFPTRGLKVIDAIALEPDGTPLGLLDLQVWSRGPKAETSKRERRRRGETETQHWVDSIDAVATRARRAGVVPWFLVDREGDASVILQAVRRAEGFFTIRVSQKDRRCFDGKRPRSVLQAMARRTTIGTHSVDVPKSATRRERTAALDVRIGRITLHLHEHGANQVELDTYVVWAHERRGPRGEERLDWMLFTNRPVNSFAEAIAIIESYCHRWRIEDFHRAWKRGHCRVEDTQLRKRDHVVRWAAMHAAVALRVERLKHLARTRPDEPATIALSPIEVEALKSAKRTQFMKRTETVGEEMPSIAVAVRWIAEYGGFAGNKSSNPGSVTIGRGLEQLLVYARGFAHGVKSARKRG